MPTPYTFPIPYISMRLLPLLVVGVVGQSRGGRVRGVRRVGHLAGVAGARVRGLTRLARATRVPLAIPFSVKQPYI